MAPAGDAFALGSVAAQGRVGAALGVTEPITSPTFNLVHEYRVDRRLTLLHADLYRLGTQHEVADLALAELVEADGVLLVEWGDVVLSMLGEHLLVRLAAVDDADEARLVEISASGRAWATRWERLCSRLEEWSC